MKRPSKFKKWFLGLFGGVPKSDLEDAERKLYYVKKQRDDLDKENDRLKNQIIQDPNTPVAIITKNIKVKEIKKMAKMDVMPIEQTEFCLKDFVLREAEQYIRIMYNPREQIASATLLLAEVENV